MRAPSPGWVLIASAICSGPLAVLSGEQFAGQLWAPIALTVLATIIKWLSQQAATKLTRQVGVAPSSPFVRFWLG